jgi:hypothetical protein
VLARLRQVRETALNALQPPPESMHPLPVALTAAGLATWQYSHSLGLLLGHCSVKITEKHYAPWVKSRQDARV